MSNSMESGGGAQPAPRPEPEDVPSYERPLEPEPEPEPPAAASEADAPAPSYGSPDPTLQSIKRRLDDLQAAAFAEAQAPTEADLREVGQVDDALSAEVDPPEAAPAEPAMREPESPAPSPSGERPALSQDEERIFAALSHLSIFVLPLLGPLIFMLLNQGRSSWLERQIKEALNFQLNMVGWGIVLAFASIFVIGLCGIPVLAVASLVLPIVAAVQAFSGKMYRYPWILRFLK